MQRIKIIVLLFFLLGNINAPAQSVDTRYINEFGNTTHPEVAYWFFASNMMQPEAWKAKVDSFAKYSKYTLIFLTARNGCDFHDSVTMRPIFRDLVAYAHQRGLKIGLQIFKPDDATKLENTDRLIQEAEVKLDDEGAAAFSDTAWHARDMKTLLKSDLLRIYAFKRSGDEYYMSSSLKDITNLATVHTTRNKVDVQIHAGKEMAGYIAYIMTQHYYQSCSNFSQQATDMLLACFRAYRDIPFDGVALDEYKNMKIAMERYLQPRKEVFRERLYSLGMSAYVKKHTGESLERMLFDMRYSPSGKPEVRIRAINHYMDVLRKSTLSVEAAVYDEGKKLFGKHCFVGVHNTFHNNLDRDEVWQTGVSWWNIKRDYGHTDEETSTPVQIGIGISYPARAMYNMYYNKSVDRIWTKALYDLRFGIRTHYHAANDVQGWGVSIDAPEALAKINPVENAVRLLNRFNPPLPHLPLLVIYGMEAQYNWYPNLADRGMYDINDKLQLEETSRSLWAQGYLHAAVPTDLIQDGRLHLNADGKPEINGHVFDAVIFLYPQYARKATISFLQQYVAKGGKLLIQGTATRDFEGNRIEAVWNAIAAKATALSLSTENIEKLGIHKNPLTDGVMNEPGSYTFTSTTSLEKNEPAHFSFDFAGNHYDGIYKGVAAIQVNKAGQLVKLAATGFLTMEENGKNMVHLNKAADVFLTEQDGKYKADIADPSHSVKLTMMKE